MKINAYISRAMLIILFFVLILNPQATFEGAKSGLVLWSGTVLPGLFPAMIISTAILALIPMQPSYKYIYIIVCGLFCGYPLGAILCSQIHKENPSEDICEKIMPYCNISSPSFMINYILRMACFNEINRSIMLFCAYLPAIEALVFMLWVNRKNVFVAPNDTTSGQTAKLSYKQQYLVDVLDNSLMQSVKNMLKLGGYITVFACFSTIINNLLQVSDLVKAIISGIIEITNGIFMCNNLLMDNNLKIILILSVNAFGGISTIMQTLGMIKGSGISIKKYIYHKLIFTALTAANTAFVIYVLI